MAIDTRTLRIINAFEQELSGMPSDRKFTAAELGMLDQIHTRGYPATVELARAVGITPEMSVLDLGAGFGGPARYLAETYGCHVEGIDLNPGLVQAAQYLSTRWAGPQELVNFTVGDATATPYPDESFDITFMQHVAMNIPDRAALYREIRRVLSSGGRLATYDVVKAGGDLIYPTPWAPDEAVSTVLTAEETRATMEEAGLRVVSIESDIDAALQWVRNSAAIVASGQRLPGALVFRAALGENFREIVGNLGKNYVEGRADVVTIIAQRD